MSRFRFVDASYNPDCRRLPSSPYLGSSGAGRGGGGEWSPRRRKVISSTQLEKLLEVFEQVDSPDIDIREKLGAEVDMTPREVQVWFQNRRAKVRREREAAEHGHKGRRSRKPSSGRCDRGQVTGEADTAFAAIFDGRSLPEAAASNDPSWCSPSGQSSFPAFPNCCWTPEPDAAKLDLTPPSEWPVPTTSDPDVPRYRKIFGQRYIALPAGSCSASSTPSPIESDHSTTTTSSASTSYFPSRVLPVPTITLSPLKAFDHLSIGAFAAAAGPSLPERDPFLPHSTSLSIRRGSEQAELIHLPPINVSNTNNVSACVVPAPAYTLPSMFGPPRGEMNLDDMLNPEVSTVARRFSASF
ncbi:hypothetical protein JCM3766R1_001783 [Sporobolomyces carnicolor]